MDATPFLPHEGAAWDELAAAAQECRGCPLWEGATQAVLGEGSLDARIVLVGEQPGDHEDIEGRPFVGPAGKELDRVLAAAGIDRDVVPATIHPSAILRARSDDDRREMRAMMVDDLGVVAGELDSTAFHRSSGG